MSDYTVSYKQACNFDFSQMTLQLQKFQFCFPLFLASGPNSLPQKGPEIQVSYIGIAISSTNPRFQIRWAQPYRLWNQESRYILTVSLKHSGFNFSVLLECRDISSFLVNSPINLSAFWDIIDILHNAYIWTT